jgi:hypothetical protein
MSARGPSRTLPDQGGNLGSSPGARSICVLRARTDAAAKARPSVAGEIAVTAGRPLRVTHLALDKDCPDSRPVIPPRIGRVVAMPKVVGLHHRYERLAA